VKHRKSVHDDLVLDVADELRRKGYEVRTFVDYDVNGFAGEMDIEARWDGRYEYHEIKSHKNSKSIRRATDQFYRVSRAFPGRYWKFYLRTPHYLEEYHI
jgi:UDP:flavonoid glycosyltransferase YjiC (YdhE family)